MAPDALHIYRQAEDMFKGHEYAVSGDVTLELAIKSKLSAYECEFIALAKELGCKLVTSDRRLHRAFPVDSEIMLKG